MGMGMEILKRSRRNDKNAHAEIEIRNQIENEGSWIMDHMI